MNYDLLNAIDDLYCFNARWLETSKRTQDFEKWVGRQEIQKFWEQRSEWKCFHPKLVPFSNPNSGKDQKKRSSLKLSPIFCPKLGASQKQRSSPTLCVLKAFAQFMKDGGMPQFCILSYADYTILATQRGTMAQWPPP